MYQHNAVVPSLAYLRQQMIPRVRNVQRLFESVEQAKSIAYQIAAKVTADYDVGIVDMYGMMLAIHLLPEAAKNQYVVPK